MNREIKNFGKWVEVILVVLTEFNYKSDGIC